MNQDPDISILMPLRNAEFWIDECIQSIIEQRYESWELLVVDDGSTDGSIEKIGGYAIADQRIRLESNRGVGIIDALNQAFMVSKGQFIHRMDADDIMPPNKLFDLMKALNYRKDVVQTGEVQYFSEDKVSSGYLDYQNWLNSIESYDAEMYRECAIASPNWLVHRSCFEDKIRLSELKYPEDYDMLLKWYEHGYKIERLNKMTHLWREHPKRTSRNSEIYQQASFFKLKLRYFVRLELSENESVQLIGAGDKGKLVAKLLQELEVDFEWFDLNPGRVESNKMVQPLEGLVYEKKSLLTNWPKNEETQSDILIYLNKHGLSKGQNLWVL